MKGSLLWEFVCCFVQRCLQASRNNKDSAMVRIASFFPHAPGQSKTLISFGLACLLNHSVFLMAFFRRHYNGFQVVIDRQSTADGYLWVVYSIVEDGLVGLTAPSLNEARGIADSLAVVSHVAECNDACNDWDRVGIVEERES